MFWTHLLLQTHQICRYLGKIFLWEKIKTWILLHIRRTRKCPLPRGNAETQSHCKPLARWPSKTSPSGVKSLNLHWASSLYLRDKPPKGLALKANRAHKHKSHKGKGNWEMVLKWLAHGLTYPLAQHGSSCLKSTKTFYERGLFAYHKLLTWGTNI